MYLGKGQNKQDCSRWTEKYLKDHDTSTYSAYYNKKMLEEKLEFLYSLKDQIEEECKRKETFINSKNKKNV